jgi:hypothetical protein
MEGAGGEFVLAQPIVRGALAQVEFHYRLNYFTPPRFSKQNSVFLPRCTRDF